MSDSEPAHASAEFAQLDAVADAIGAAKLRQEFSQWIRMHFALDAERSSDMVLAVNEALANAAEFAYRALDHPGTMHLRCYHDRSAAVLTVEVSDEGAWRIADSETPSISRGRGIPLMRALADRATIDSTSSGTQVRLEWQHVATAQQLESAGHDLSTDCRN